MTHASITRNYFLTCSPGVEDQATNEDTQVAISTPSMSGITPRPSVLPPVGTVHEGNPSLGPEEAGSLQGVEQGEESTAARERKERREEKRLAIMMMSKKRKRLYDQIMKSRRKKAKEVRELKRKRREFDETQTSAKKTKVF